MVSGLKICNLADFREFIPLVSEWRFKDWAEKYGHKLEEIVKRTRKSCNRNKIPLTFIALCNGKPAGTVALWKTDLETRKDLGPWLSTLFVVPEERQKGIGVKLLEVGVHKARELGEKKLFLCTDLDSYYEKFGWNFVSNEKDEIGETTRLYELEL